MSFESLFGNTLANIISAIIILVFGAVLGWIGTRLIERRPLRLLLGLQESRGEIIVLATPVYIIPGTTSISDRPGIPLTPLGPVFAFKSITNLITSAYPKLANIRLYFSNDFPSELHDQNLFLIGFPKANEVTKDVMSNLDLPLIFDNHTLVNSKTNKPVYNAVVEDNQVVEDYGCLIRAPNPYSDGSVVFIFAGCQTYGVKAAADFFSVTNILELRGITVSKLQKRLLSRLPFLLLPQDNNFYQIILRVKVKDHFIYQPTVVAYHKIAVVGGRQSRRVGIQKWIKSIRRKKHDHN